MLAGATLVTALLYLNRPQTEIAEPTYRPVTVDVAEVVKENLRITVQAQGTVTPLRQSSLVSEVQGRVVEVSPQFTVGGFVARDEMLLKIDPRDYEAALLQARASLASAESNLAQERGQADVARREWERLPAGSQRSDQARDLYLRKPQLEQARAQLLAARADLETAQNNLAKTVIRAPYAALVSARHSDLGEFLTPGSPITDILSVSEAEVRLPIPKGRLDYLDLPGLGELGRHITIDLYTDTGAQVRHWQARLHRTEGLFDERSRVLYAVARIDDPYALENRGQQPLRFGTFVHAAIQGRSFENIVTLPRYILRPGNTVWIVDGSGYLRNRRLTLLNTTGDSIYITGGLDEGDLVSLTALHSSLESAKVTMRSRKPSDQLDDLGQPREVSGTPLDGATAAVSPDLETPEG